MNCRIWKKHDELTRKGRRIQLALNFWTRVANVTRFGLHGFVLWRIHRAYQRAVEFNMIAQAHKRERGDSAKLREALGKLRAELWNNTVIAGKRKFELYEIADAALSAPPRNCDVGTVGQQDERFTAFCNRHFNAVGLCDKDCPCRDFNMIGGACSIVWAQMPYEGGAK